MRVPQALASARAGGSARRRGGAEQSGVRREWEWVWVNCMVVGIAVGTLTRGLSGASGVAGVVVGTLSRGLSGASRVMGLRIHVTYCGA